MDGVLLGSNLILPTQKLSVVCPARIIVCCRYTGLPKTRCSWCALWLKESGIGGGGGRLVLRRGVFIPSLFLTKAGVSTHRQMLEWRNTRIGVCGGVVWLVPVSFGEFADIACAFFIEVFVRSCRWN